MFFKDKTHFDNKFKDNSWRSRTSGNLRQHGIFWHPRVVWSFQKQV